MTTCLRAAAVLALGILISIGLLYLLVPVRLLNRLVTAEVYRVAISDTDAYNRVYDEVLADETLRDQTDDLLGDIEIATYDDVVALLREIMPPAYLQEQTENNIDRFTGYLRGETERLEIYVELRAPLERVEPAARAWVFRFIDELEIAEPTDSGCSLDATRRLAAGYAEPVARLSKGKPVESAPSLKSLTRTCREQDFDRWLNLTLSDPAIDSRASLLLGEAREELRQPFVEGDTRAFLKAAATPLIGPLIDDAIADIRRELQPNDRLDLIEQVAEESGDLTREDIEDQAAALRERMNAARGTGKYIAFLVVALGSLLLSAVHLPRPTAMLRWPGTVLVVGGTVCLGVGLALNSIIPGQLKKAITLSEFNTAEVPTSALNLAGDLLESFGRQATAGFVPPAVAVILLGAALIVASVFKNSQIRLARKFFPITGGRLNR